MPTFKFFSPNLFLTFLATFTLISFQNCARVRFTQITDLASLDFCSNNPTAAECLSVPAPVCRLNGIEHKEGASVRTYLSSSVGFGQTCQSELRICKSGGFTGSFLYATCSVGVAASCLFNGSITIPHGGTVTAYTNSTVSFDQKCDSEVRTCNNGVLSGSKQFPSCNVGVPANCSFNGSAVAHGTSVTAYPTSSVGFGKVCTPETRQCINGNLSGLAAFGSCSVGAPSSCLFNQRQIPHGGSIVANQTSSVDFGQTCKAETRNCANGSLSGSYNFETCSPGAPKSCILNGKTYAHGQTATQYETESVAFTAECNPESSTCENGIFAPAFKFTHSSCTRRPLKSLDLNLASNTTNAAFKLLLVIDNSNSMAASQEKIAAKLDSLLLPLKGRNVDVKLVSTSDTISDIGKIYNSRTNALIGETARGSGGHPAAFQTTPADPIHVIFDNEEMGTKLFKLQASDSDQTLAAQIAQIKTEIKALGVRGADTEKSFCPIARQLYDTSPSAFFKQGDKSAIIVLSDEDDQSVSFPETYYNQNDYYQCMASSRANYKTPKITTSDGTAGSTSYWARYEYNVKQVAVKYTYTYVTEGTYSDGKYTPGQEYPGYEGQSLMYNAASYKNEPAGPCSASLTEQSKYNMGSGSYNQKDHVFKSCEVQEYLASRDLYYTNAKPTVNLCHGGTYSDIYDTYNSGKTLDQILAPYYESWSQQVRVGTVCNFTAHEQFYPGSDPSSSTTRELDGQRIYTPIITANSHQDFIDKIFAKANSLFNSSYFMTFIVNTTTPPYTQENPSQALGANYIKAAQDHPNHAEAVSIVAPDYSLALKKISDFITKNIVTEYSPQIPSQATLVKVELISAAGQTRILSAAEYTFAAGKLKITAELKADDKLRIYYAE